MYFLLRIGNIALILCVLSTLEHYVVNLWVLLNSLQNVDFIVSAGNQSDWVQTASSFLPSVAVVPMFIWVSKTLLCCFGSIPCMSLSRAWAVDDTVVPISETWL